MVRASGPGDRWADPEKEKAWRKVRTPQGGAPGNARGPNAQYGVRLRTVPQKINRQVTRIDDQPEAKPRADLFKSCHPVRVKR